MRLDNRESSKIKLSRKDKTYVDISLAFQPSPLTGDLTLLTNERAINNSIKNIIMILPSEVPFDRDIGSNTTSYLFDFADESTTGLLAGEIERAILFCEPRVTFTEYNSNLELIPVGSADDYNVEVIRNLGVFVNSRPDQNEFEVTVRYRIVGGEKTFRVQEILTPTR
tara:strand:- start:7172 stop:7675 length:504 start_codon:yes stop_codon:yes gene_type:complete